MTTALTLRQAEKPIKVRAKLLGATKTGVDRGVDLTVRVRLPGGQELRGEVTLLPAEDGRAVYEAWGDPSNWISGMLLADLNAAYEKADPSGRNGRRDALREIEAVASDAAGEPEDV